VKGISSFSLTKETNIFVKNMNADGLNAAHSLGAEKYPRQSDKWIQYGTAGFRTK